MTAARTEARAQVGRAERAFEEPSPGCADEAHLAARALTRSFVEREIAPRSAAIAAEARIPDALVRALGQAGFFGLMIATEHGGMGRDCLARLANVEMVAAASPDVGALLQIAQLGTGALLEFGDDRQQRTWLPQLARGERICTIAITEPVAGSHVKAIDTTYRRTAGGLCLTGEKWFIGNAPIANLHVVFARDADSGVYSAVLVEGERPGVDNSERHQTRGLPGFPLGKLKLQDVDVPLENVVGELGQGQAVIHRVIARHGRLSVTGLALGIQARTLREALGFARSRELYGGPIARLPDVRRKVFEIYQAYETSRALAYQAARLEAQGQRAHRLLALAKYVSSESACRSAMIAAELFGARTNLQYFDAGRLVLDALMTQAPSGTADVLRRRILEDVLGERPVAWDETSPARRWDTSNSVGGDELWEH